MPWIDSIHESLAELSEVISDFIIGGNINNFVSDGRSAIADSEPIMVMLERIKAALPNSPSAGNRHIVAIRRMMELTIRSTQYILEEFERLLDHADTP